MMERIAYTLLAWLMTLVVDRRKPDWTIGDPERPYLLRWWLIPRNRWFNVYLHMFLRSDDDRALHDHPWPWLSMILGGRYVEHTIRAGGIHQRRERSAGSVAMRLPWTAHRVEVFDGELAWTLFVTGPVLRTWGFHCQNGWKRWQDFTDPATKGATTGRGCDP